MQVARGRGRDSYCAKCVKWNSGGIWNSSASIRGHVRRTRKMSSMVWFANAAELNRGGFCSCKEGLLLLSQDATSWPSVFCEDRKAKSDGNAEDQGPKSEKKGSNRFGSNVDWKSCGWKVFRTSVVEKSGISSSSMRSSPAPDPGVLGSSAAVYWQWIPRV